MTHLQEEQFIDLLLGEPRSVTLDEHLAKCLQCQQQLAKLEKGMALAKLVEPDMAQVKYPSVSYGGYKQKALKTRLVWLAAAAMFILSLLGFRLESNKGSWSVQLSLLGKNQEQSQQIAALEQRLLEAIELNNKMTQSQLDARFHAIYQEREQDFGDLREVVVREMRDLETSNSQQLIAVRDEFKGDLEKFKVEGKLQ